MGLWPDYRVRRLVENERVSWGRFHRAVDTVVAETGYRKEYRCTVLCWNRENSQFDPWSWLILVGTKYSFWALLHELGHLAHTLQEWAKPRPRMPSDIPRWECELWAWRWAFRLADELGVSIDRQALEFSLVSHRRSGAFHTLLKRKELSPSPDEEELLRWTVRAGIWPLIAGSSGADR